MEFIQTILYPILFASLFFEVFILLTYAESLNKDESYASVNPTFKLPKVAVIVPCHNEETTVSKTIRSILALDYPKYLLEIIIVNDGSTDDTGKIIDSFAEEYKTIRVIHQEKGGKHTAMNSAVKITDAEIVGCLDADSFVKSDALKKIVNKFRDPKVSAVTPNIKVAHADTLIQKIQYAEYGLSAFLRKSFAHAGALFITPGPVFFFRREVVISAGLWKKAHNTEDMEMGLRLQSLGKNLANESGAIVYTSAPKTFLTLYKQRVRWGYGFIKNAIDYRKLMFNKKHQALGFLVLPFGLFSIFGVVFVFSFSVLNLILEIYSRIYKLLTVGFTKPVIVPDIFFVNNSAYLFVAFVLILLTSFAIAIGKRLGNDKILSYDIPLYIFVFGILSTTWLATAAIKAFANSETRWK